MKKFSQCLSVIPDIFGGSKGLCEFIAFIHFYAGLANITSVLLLVVYYRHFFYHGYLDLISFLKKYSFYVVTIFPLITALPFTMNAYNETNERWCTISSYEKVSNIWAFAVFYAFVWLFLLISIALLVPTAAQVYIADHKLGGKLLSTVGTYCLVSVICWIPRTLERLAHFSSSSVFFSESENLHIFSYLPIYICGISYFFIFQYERRSLKQYEEYLDSIQNSESLMFSWEHAESLSEDSKIFDALRGFVTDNDLSEKFVNRRSSSF